VFCDPSSASSVAGLLKMHSAGRVPPESVVTCTLTGNGLKDPQWALEGAADPVVISVDSALAAEKLGLM